MPIPSPIHVVIQQPSLARYRVPVYRELAHRPGIDLHLLYGHDPLIPNVEPEGFKGTLVPFTPIGLPGSVALWHKAQYSHATLKRADVVILSWSSRFLSLVPALIRARRNGVGTILWGHGYSKTETGWRADTRRRIADMGTALLFYNRTAASAYIAGGASSPERVFVALNSLDQTPIRAARDAWLNNPQRLAAFQATNDLVGTQTILYVSRFDPANRLDLLLRAAAKLAPDLPRLRVALIGKGQGQDEVRALADTLGIADRVRFLGAIYEEDSLAPWFLSSQVFCYPANIGLSILHAFGYSLPVITSDKREQQNPEIESLRHGHNGLVYPDGDAEALTQALRQLLTDDALRARLSSGALATVETEFCLPRMVDGMEAAIRYAAAKAR
ncbi:MAG TPA: glycosyltransferase family 4 protein [Phycisphaerales bacterium]|nr:glycosyltransferase family 4 protein [Phycisphaerales bacterium]